MFEVHALYFRVKLNQDKSWTHHITWEILPKIFEGKKIFACMKNGLEEKREARNFAIPRILSVPTDHSTN